MPLLLIALLSAAGAEARPMPPYAEALNCAGATQAAVEGQERAAETARVFDSAVYWSLAAMDIARRDGKTAAQAEADQKAARDSFKVNLDADDAEAWAAVKACVKATPPV